MSIVAGHESRRRFLAYLAASPLCNALAGFESARADDSGIRVADPAGAIDIFDLEATAAGNIPAAHWGYLATGVNGDATLRANRKAFEKYAVRARRLLDVSNVDTSVDILGQRWKTPIVIAPVGSHKAFHPDGEIAVARAARSRDHLQLLSTVASTPIEAVAEARDAPIWFQLYTTGGWPEVRKMLRRAENAACPVVVLTVDLAGGTSSRHTLARAIRRDDRNCDACHAGDGIAAGPKPMFRGVSTEGIREEMVLTWQFLEQLREETSMKVFVKGIVAGDDAERCVDIGVDGIIVSNHGGRGEESGRGAIDSLVEVAGAVRGRTTVFMDSGIRRGVDIFKALALGADAIMVGRPYIWGLGAFGQTGVERALDILTDELRVAMQSFGTPSISDIGPESIVAA